MSLSLLLHEALVNKHGVWVTL